MRNMGGLWQVVPRMGGAMLFFALAALGLPGMGNFVGEFLVLFGTYRVSIPLTALATGGLILSTVYGLWMMQRTFYGTNDRSWKIPDLSFREAGAMAAMICAILWLGLYPGPFIDTAKSSIEAIQMSARKAEMVRPTEDTLRIHFMRPE